MLDILTRALCFIAIIVLGYILRQKGFFGPEAFGLLSKVVMKITLPAAIIASSSGKTMEASMLAIFFLGLGFGVVYMFLGFLLKRKQSRAEQAFSMLNLSGYNIGTFALPFTSSFLGPMGVITTSLFDAGNAFVCLGGAFGVARAMKEGGKMDVKRIAKALATSIPFLTHLMMVTWNLNGWKLPGPVVELAGIIGNANAFLAMLMIGVGFHLSGERSQLRSVVRILSVRYGLAVLLALGIYFLLPYSLEIRQTLVILVFAPVSSAVPVFTGELKEDAGLSSAINSISIVISIAIIVALLVFML